MGQAALDLARAFVARADLQMVLTDMDGRFLELSRGFRETQLKGSEDAYRWLLTQGADEAAPARAALRKQVIARLMAGELTVVTEEGVGDSDGGQINLRMQTSLWRDEAGRPVGTLAVLQDVTAEREARYALGQSEAKLRAVLEHVPAQVSMTDVESGRVTVMNRRMAEGLGGFSGWTVQGEEEGVFLTPDNLRDLQRLAANVETGSGHLEYEHTIQTGPAAGRKYRLSLVVFRDRGDRRQLLMMAEDATDRYLAAEALERAAREAEAANRAKSEFLANMSHEIRTPLNGVMGVAGALAKTPLASDQREMVSIIETSARTLETLLSDILDLARIEEGRMELRSEAFDLAESVNACAALFDAAAQAKGIDLHVAIAPDALGGYVGDPARLRQILSNLLSNAVKFTPRGQVALRVDAVATVEGQALRFEVRDSGIGFDAETKARLFSRFEQADGSITRRFGGTGLGLAISRSLALAMGGGLDAEATPGQGAAFTLTLTLPRCHMARAEAPQEQTRSDPLPGLRVLLAEDHPTNRRVVELILGAAGVDLTCVEDGAQAVAAFQQGGLEVILMDMQMPVMDGLTAIREIRRLEAEGGSGRVPIVVLTANAMPEHIDASKAAGADGHLSKPILAELLLTRLAELAANVEPPGRADLDSAASA
jgi:PAS domain S-box-containing protein